MNLSSKSLCSRTPYIPDTHMHLIFDKIDSKLDRDSFGLTCHRFLEIQNSSRKTLNLEYLPWLPHSRVCIDIEDFMLEKLLNRFRKLESLSLTGCKNVSDSGLALLQKHGNKIHTLHLDFTLGVTEIGFSYIASGCPLLSVINLFSSCVSNRKLEILTESCKLLKEINLGDCTKINDYGIRPIIQNCRQLRALKISSCDNIYGLSFEGCSLTLACLEANDCAFIPRGFTEILSGGGLEYLNLASHSKFLEGRGLAAIGLGVAANLKILNLYMCSFVTDDAIISISKGCPLLQEWNLTNCNNVMLSGWESIGLHCQSLERIHVSGCSKLCDEGLLALGNGCRRLSVIYMKQCSQITSDAIQLFKIQRKDVEISEKVMAKNVPSWAFTISPRYKL
ncbi:leucine-rich repeat domain, L domain-like protein [Artemisia annua]|uniref:Leucine-rich repeat domain, L domain-like protein n=1 Tax=Artemisia annua TaxID=35608 RepID=A0A2U1LWG9_ARTAN|nr:leucine-rich repeat domain, L domain-like protein [Artemisia annua]